MKRPNFFIIGAPKCGTTSMAAWLSEHPRIYISPEKEPHYFSEDMDKDRDRKLSSYESLFEEADDQHIAVGEASTHYLFSQVAVPNILEYTTDAKFIVMLRNPVEMAYSLHEQKVYEANEHVKDFERAWRLQEERKQGRNISKWCVDPQLLQYGSICRLGEQLDRLYSIVPKERVHIILMDDMKQDTLLEYQRTLEFLEVPDDGRTVFPVYNPAKVRRSDLMSKVVKLIYLTRRRLKIPSLHTGILNKINQLNTKERPRKSLTPEMMTELKNYFRDDVYKLSKLLDRDLTSWVE